MWHGCWDQTGWSLGFTENSLKRRAYEVRIYKNTYYNQDVEKSLSESIMHQTLKQVGLQVQKTVLWCHWFTARNFGYNSNGLTKIG